MLAYKRDLDRAASRADRIERESTQSSLRCNTVEQCWQTIVRELNAVLGPDGEHSSEIDEDTHMQMATTNGHATDNDNDKQQVDPIVSLRLKQTKHLIATLLNYSSSTSSSSSKPLPKDLSIRFQTVSAEVRLTF